MKESYLFDKAFNNVVFKGRNMAYRAYKLRRLYNRHILVAAIVGSTLFAGALAIPMIKSTFFKEDELTNKQADKVVPDEGIIIPILPPPPIELIKQKQILTQPKQEKVAAIKYVEPKVVKDNVDTPEDIPEQSKLKTAVISTITQEGTIPDAPNKIVNSIPEGPGIGTELNSEPYIIVEEMPVFGKKESDLMNYLNKNIRYPKQAINAGIEGMVIVSFVVTNTGKVQDVQVLKGLGYGTEDEAIRVVTGMPEWKPGRQNGHPVNVRYTLPIRLQMQN